MGLLTALAAGTLSGGLLGAFLAEMVSNTIGSRRHGYEDKVAFASAAIGGIVAFLVYAPQ